VVLRAPTVDGLLPKEVYRQAVKGAGHGLTEVNPCGRPLYFTLKPAAHSVYFRRDACELSSSGIAKQWSSKAAKQWNSPGAPAHVAVKLVK